MVVGQKSHWDSGYSVIRHKTQTEGVITVTKKMANLGSETVQFLLRGDLTCLQSVVKNVTEHAL